VLQEQLFVEHGNRKQKLYKICLLQTLYKWLGLFAVDVIGDEHNVGSQSMSK